MKPSNTTVKSILSMFPESLVVALGGLLLPAASSQDGGKVDPGIIQGKLVFQSMEGEVLKKAPPGVVVTDAVLYLVGEGLASNENQGPGGDLASEAAKPLLDQVDITFVPHVLPVVAGTTVQFRNGDATVHNIHTYSQKNQSFNKSQAPKGHVAIVYDEPEIVHVGCDIHSQMSAYIVVVPNRFFAMGRKDGSFSIEGIPPGTYELVGWHEKYGTTSQKVEIGPGSSTQVEVTFKKEAKRRR